MATTGQTIADSMAGMEKVPQVVAEYLWTNSRKVPTTQLQNGSLESHTSTMGMDR